jgi:hypothetical protein
MRFLALTRYSVMLLGLVMVFSPILATEVLASPPHQMIECDGDEIPVSTSILSLWPNTDFCTFNIDYGDVLSGGVGRDQITPVYPTGYVYPDGIPNYGGDDAANYENYQSIEEADEWLADQSPVIAAELNGEARAYPLGVMTLREIANTTIGGVPVAVTFCPLCNTGIVYERELDGQLFHFGVSGFLRNSDLIMWDHETESWWQQATGMGIVGEMTDTQLEFVTSSMVSYGEFKTAFPDGEILAPIRSSNGELLSSTDQNPYPNYDSGQPFLFRGEIDDRLPPTERVLGYTNGSGDERIAIGYPFSLLSEAIVINDMVGDRQIVVFWQPGATSALDASSISESREIGSGNIFDRILDDGTVLTFYADGTTIRDEQTDSTWNIFGQATDGELVGTQLVQLRMVNHFWFAWYAFEPDTLLWEGEE